MDILVCISKAPDTTAKINFENNNTQFSEAGVQFIVNPYDEWYALVRALELKEALGGKVSIISVGGADYDPILRKALAIGADDAYRVDVNATDSMQCAAEIAAFAKDKNFDLILCGKETIDFNGSNVAGMIAAMLDRPFASNAVKLDIAGTEATIEHDVQGGTEVLSAQLPMIVSCAKGMAEQRIPNMRGIMAARSKPLSIITARGAGATTEIESYALPPEKGAVKLIDPENAEEIINLLHTEAKVI